jgi:Dolichyl-phosphate-mannose-protein mannosyltransferase
MSRIYKIVAHLTGWRFHILLLCMLGIACVLMIMISNAIVLQVTITSAADHITARVGSDTVETSISAPLNEVAIPKSDPLIHEYQIDGTDSTNNSSLDHKYLASIANTPYYRFYAWMRDLDDLSRWNGAKLWDDSHKGQSFTISANKTTVISLKGDRARIEFTLEHPETARTIDLSTSDGKRLRLHINRNAHEITFSSVLSPTVEKTLAQSFIPDDLFPYASLIVDFMARSLLWSLFVLGMIVLCEALLAPIWSRIASILVLSSHSTRRLVMLASRAILSLPLIVWLMMAISFGYTIWIALALYHAQPHIYDASAYLYGAELYASGRLTGPIPPVQQAFPGPFVIDLAGERFTQYIPGTSATLAIGVKLGVPWLIEPIMGVLTLWGIGLIAGRLYDRYVASLAVILGTLSPFYLYLSASYMSHTIALCYLVWGAWCLLYFCQGGPSWLLVVMALLFGMGWLTRDMIALLFMAIMITGIVMLYWRQLNQRLYNWLPWAFTASSIAVCFAISIYWYNQRLMGDPFLSPREWLAPFDRFGFGDGIGFYSKHTLAAGMITLHELLTSLATDLYGWPFYLTLVFLAIPFLARRVLLPDWLMLMGCIVMIGIFAGFYYHGIYLGPRYLYESLPFLLILTARGIIVLSKLARQVAQQIHNVQIPDGISSSASIATIILVLTLVGYNLIYYLPRQVAIYTNFTGLPATYHIDLGQIYHPPIHHALIMTTNRGLYQYVLFPLNDPDLRGDNIYALISSYKDQSELHVAFPQRQMYIIQVSISGTVSYVPIAP